jgi:anti-sigma factor (TIGR02949 family)
MSEQASNPKKISCKEALRLVNEFIDGELDGVSSADVKTHFELCKRCYPHLKLESHFREALKRACTRDKASSALRERVKGICSGGRSDG